MPYQYDTRTITHNTSFGFYSTITSDQATKAVTFGAPVEFTGLSGVKIETKQDYEDKYADGQVHVTVAGAEQVTGEIASLQISQKFWEDALGRKVVSISGTSGGAKSLLNTGTRKAFVFVFAEDVTDEFNNISSQWTILTNAKASVPTKEAATDEDKISEVTYAVPLTITANSAVLDADGKSVREITAVDDATGTIQKLVDQLFGESPTLTMKEFIDAMVGKVPSVPGGGV